MISGQCPYTNIPYMAIIGMSNTHNTTIQEIPTIILDQLKSSKINGFPFFAYTGIKDFVMEGEDTLSLTKIPKNPKNVTRVSVVYDYGTDTYNVYIMENNAGMIGTEPKTDIYVDQLADTIAQGMGVC